ncbi:MAG: cation-translocating P-type ATPase [Chloroflexia bacterium]|nr:cation-translocating P-type ATPase [Chloroflexia bacterium]
MDAYALSAEDVASELSTNLEQGLSNEQAQALLAQVGPNELPQEAPTPLWKRFLDQFKSFLIIILLVAALISVGVAIWGPESGGEEFIDAGAIFAIVLLNAVMGVVQESRAENALRALHQMAAPNAQVIRDGTAQMVPARELVPGDLVILEAGNYVPADIRLVESANLRIEEAALTGESVPVEKRAAEVFDDNVPLGDRVNCAFMGTVVSYGRGRGVVVSTGQRTQLGLIAEMLRSYEAEPTPLQVKLDQLGRWLGIASLAICGVVFAVGLMRPSELPFNERLLEMFMIAVSLAIAAVPEGLPAVVTVCLALGTQRMLRQHALIRNLPAVETLGSATVICSDKTGTLTQNEMTVVKLYAGHNTYSVEGRGYQPWGQIHIEQKECDMARNPALHGLLLCGLLCNDARLEPHEEQDHERYYRMIGDPTEGALVVLAAKAQLWRPEVEERLPRLDEVPFDSTRKRMTTVHRWTANGSGEPLPFAEGVPYMAFTKGAPDLLLERCNRIVSEGHIRTLSQEDRRTISATMDGMAGDALRVLALACRPLDELPADADEGLENDLVFLGLSGMIDPPRLEVRPAIQKARHAGIKTIMITGDHKRTAMAIANDLHMFTPGLKGLTGAELEEMDQDEFRQVAQIVDVYARVSPEHKVRIVDALKERGHIVAMTGDGVNDAPALKRADIGVAMGITGTDVAKEAADMVLTDDNYASIVSAVEEGRVIFANIRKFVYYLLSCNVGEILIIFLATLMTRFPALPLQPIHLLMINLVTDGFPALALGMEPAEPGVMDRPPRSPKEPIINREMWWGTLLQSVLICISTLVAFAVGLEWFEGEIEHAQTFAFATLVVTELLRAFTTRSERAPIWRLGLLTNRTMLWAVGSSLLVLLAIIYVPFLDPIFNTVPLTLKEWELLIPLTLLPAVGAELRKVFMRWRDKRTQSEGAVGELGIDLEEDEI